jgi:hypothetical protein
MRGGIPPLRQYTFMAWCWVKKHGDNFYFTFAVSWKAGSYLAGQEIPTFMEFKRSSACSEKLTNRFYTEPVEFSPIYVIY